MDSLTALSKQSARNQRFQISFTTVQQRVTVIDTVVRFEDQRSEFRLVSFQFPPLTRRSHQSQASSEEKETRFEQMLQLGVEFARERETLQHVADVAK